MCVNWIEVQGLYVVSGGPHRGEEREDAETVIVAYRLDCEYVYCGSAKFISFVVTLRAKFAGNNIVG